MPRRRSHVKAIYFDSSTTETEESAGDQEEQPPRRPTRAAAVSSPPAAADTAPPAAVDTAPAMSVGERVAEAAAAAAATPVMDGSMAEKDEHPASAGSSSRPSIKRKEAPPSQRSSSSKAARRSYQFHPNSKWKEPPREDDNNQLTLWDLHRPPRPVLSGRVQRPIQALYSNFKCSICLGFIRHTRIVTECLHRFCEECIETSLRFNNHFCPMCRVPIPSRRSLASDKRFDTLIHTILGDVAEATDVPVCTEPSPEIVRKRPPPGATEPEASVEATSSQGDDVEDEEEDPVARLPAASELPTLVELKLIRYARESRVPNLSLPYLRMQGDATIGVLKTFLSQKLDRLDVLFKILLPMPHSRTSRKEKELDDWITLKQVASMVHAQQGSTSEQSYLTLIYKTQTISLA